MWHCPETGQRTEKTNIDLRPRLKKTERATLLSDQQYYQTLSEADILCVPRSGLDYSNAGFPFKPSEYLATGKPVVASAIFDIKSLLHDLEDMTLTTPDSVNSLVSVVERLLDNNWLADTIGKRGMETTDRLFDHRGQGTGLLSLLKDVPYPYRLGACHKPLLTVSRRIHLRY